MATFSGREREASLIRQANRAAAVGKLMLNEISTWQEFLEVDTFDLESLPRRYLKVGLSDVKKRLSPEIQKFCLKNFRGMDEKKLSMLYEEIKTYRGLELPLAEAVRSAILCSFNLLESYLNGLAWGYVQTHGTADLSNTQRKLLEDAASVSIRDKLKKYPQILAGRELWKESDEEFDEFIDVIKPFRDSLVHPSPFSAPERFGGYGKLRLFYRIDDDTAVLTANLLVRIIKKIHYHIHSDIQTLPEWISQLESGINEISK